MELISASSLLLLLFSLPALSRVRLAERMELLAPLGPQVSCWPPSCHRCNRCPAHALLLVSTLAVAFQSRSCLSLSVSVSPFFSRSLPLYLSLCLSLTLCLSLSLSRGRPLWLTRSRLLSFTTCLVASVVSGNIMCHSPGSNCLCYSFPHSSPP